MDNNEETNSSDGVPARGLVVAIAGRYCAGKDAACDTLVDLGYERIDIDDLGKRALNEKRDDIAMAFGDAVLASDGTVDRVALGGYIFTSTKTRQKYESVVYPWIALQVFDAIESFRSAGSDGPRGIVLNDPLLFYLGIDRFCDRIVVVKAPPFVRFVRAWSRDSSNLVRMLQRLTGSRFLVPPSNRKEPTAEVLSVHNVASLNAFRRQIVELEGTLHRFAD